MAARCPTRFGSRGVIFGTAVKLGHARRALAAFIVQTISVGLAQFALEQLAARVSRQRLGKHDVLWRFERGQMRAAMGMTASFDSDCPALTTMTATTASTQRGCGTPTTATSDTCGSR